MARIQITNWGQEGTITSVKKTRYMNMKLGYIISSQVNFYFLYEDEK